jgi:hypothetical protein
MSVVLEQERRSETRVTFNPCVCRLFVLLHVIFGCPLPNNTPIPSNERTNGTDRAGAAGSPHAWTARDFREVLPLWLEVLSMSLSLLLMFVHEQLMFDDNRVWRTVHRQDTTGCAGARRRRLDGRNVMSHFRVCVSDTESVLFGIVFEVCFRLICRYGYLIGAMQLGFHHTTGNHREMFTGSFFMNNNNVPMFARCVVDVVVESSL